MQHIRAIFVASVLALVATILVAQQPAAPQPTSQPASGTGYTVLADVDQLQYLTAENSLMEAQIAYLHWQTQVNLRTQSLETVKQSIFSKHKVNNPACAITVKGGVGLVLQCPKETTKEPKK